MKKSWVWVLLLLSVGVNVGILATIGVARFKGPGRFDPGRYDAERFDSRRGERSPEPRMSEQRFSPPLDRMADNLELEGETREEFIAIQKNFFLGMLEQRQDLERVRRMLRSEMVADQPDRGRIDGLLVEIGESHANLDRIMVSNVLETREILGPDQQRRYFHLLRRVQEAMGGGGPRGRDRPEMERRGPGGRGPDSRDPNTRQRPERKPPG